MYICICINVFEYKYTWGKNPKPAIFLIRYWDIEPRMVSINEL